MRLSGPPGLFEPHVGAASCRPLLVASSGDDTVDKLNPAWPNIYYTTTNPWFLCILVYEVFLSSRVSSAQAAPWHTLFNILGCWAPVLSEVLEAIGT